MGDHGFYLKEERHYDACVRVPFIVSGPNMQKGVSCDEFVQLEDICPTIYEMAQIMPKTPPLDENLIEKYENVDQFHGRSLVDLCKGEMPSRWRTYAYIESYNALWSMEFGDWARTIRSRSYRYTYYPNGNGEQLFDLINDPDEVMNLANDNDFLSVKMKMKDQLLESIIKQDYPKTTRNLYKFGIH